MSEVEADERELKLTAVPRAGKNALPAVSAHDHQVRLGRARTAPRIGRLDEVFRTLTGAGRAGVRPRRTAPSVGRERGLEARPW